METRNAHEHTGSAEAVRPSLRNGFNGFLRALPGDRAFLSPSLANESANLTPASRRQDHTTSPSASKTLSSEAPPASIASSPASVTIAIRPSSGVDGGGYKAICDFGKPEYFFRWDWTSQNRQSQVICASGSALQPTASVARMSAATCGDASGSQAGGYRLVHPATLSDSMHVYCRDMDDPEWSGIDATSSPAEHGSSRPRWLTGARRLSWTASTRCVRPSARRGSPRQPLRDRRHRGSPGPSSRHPDPAIKRRGFPGPLAPDQGEFQQRIDRSGPLSPALAEWRSRALATTVLGAHHPRRRRFRSACRLYPFQSGQHGLARRVRDWPYSSFHRYVREGRLPDDWAGDIGESGTDFGEPNPPP